jgi:hypothetical protein
MVTFVEREAHRTPWEAPPTLLFSLNYHEGYG